MTCWIIQPNCSKCGELDQLHFCNCIMWLKWLAVQFIFLYFKLIFYLNCLFLHKIQANIFSWNKGHYNVQSFDVGGYKPGRGAMFSQLNVSLKHFKITQSTFHACKRNVLTSLWNVCPMQCGVVDFEFSELDILSLALLSSLPLFSLCSHQRMLYC